MGRKLGAVPLLRGTGAASNTMSPSGTLIHIQPFGHNGHGPKIRGGGYAPLVRAGSPFKTMWPGQTYLNAKFHLDPSNRLATIHQRYRQDRQTTDRQT